jgi:hypothetical protein
MKDLKNKGVVGEANGSKLIDSTLIDSELTDFGLTDSELLTLCQKYGRQARFWRQKFIGLLPEVDKRELYLKKGCQSVYEFAAKLGGVSHEQVRRVINIEKRFLEEGTKGLRKMLIEGEVSVNKLARVVSVATKENEEELVHYVRKLSKSALETWVRDGKYAELNQKNCNDRDDREKLDLFGDSISGSESVPGHKLEMGNEGGICKEGSDEGGGDLILKLGLSSEVIAKLKELKEKGIDVNEMLVGMLKKREEELEERKLKQTKKVVSREVKRKIEGRRPSRYIAAETRKILKEEHGTNCSVPQCKRRSAAVHHTARFGLTRSNNPYFLAPLCREHHEIAHSIDEKVFKKRKM